MPMNGSINKPHDAWVDNVKLFACILVVLSHFVQSMIKTQLLPPKGIWLWFEQTIYLFHVPLFLICSGYLYQKYTEMYSLMAWGRNVLKKAVVLGVPYLCFSILSWLLKVYLASHANSQVGSLVQVLFIEPIAPYWYLYTLFFLFLIVPVAGTKKRYLCTLLIALIFKGIYICEIEFGVYVFDSLCSNSIWFVLGMGLAFIDCKKIMSHVRSLLAGAILGVCFLVGSVYVYKFWIWNRLILLLLGIMACIAVLLIIGHISSRNSKNSKRGFLVRYTMPIFLMHTIFAAGIRVMLLQIEIVSLPVHCVLGVAGSFIGPIGAAIVLARIPYGDFMLYPGKYVEMKGKSNE